MPKKLENQVLTGDAISVLRAMPDACCHLAVTSPPYWNVVDYECEDQIGQSSYEQYLADLLVVWSETARVLVPNGKLCINAPIMPVPKSVNEKQHTRELKDIAGDMRSSIVDAGLMDLFSVFIWQKQTTTKMFGSYPFPPNIYEDNTVEFIHVYVKPGKPRTLARAVKEKSKLSQDEWLDLTRQVWWMYSEDVKRTGGHPAPFPVELPARLIAMYSFAAVPELGFQGDVVLDMFSGSGTTCVAAKRMGRRFVGIDACEEYNEFARNRLEPRMGGKLRIKIGTRLVKKGRGTRREQQTVLFGK
ncbi:MAG: site-specific DNA-methyltransferase [Planctomycetota bacterium]